MMRKKTVLLPVGYHKNRAFFDTWLYSIAGAAFVETQVDLEPRMVALETPTCDFKALFCRSADPALDRFLMGR